MRDDAEEKEILKKLDEELSEAEYFNDEERGACSE